MRSKWWWALGLVLVFSTTVPAAISGMIHAPAWAIVWVQFGFIIGGAIIGIKASQ